MPEPISPAVQSLLELFDDELKELKFPDVDAAALEAAADKAREAALAVERAELALDAARQALAERQEQLLAKSQRALAYARVFAEDAPELLARLEAIALPRLRKPAGPVGEPPAPKRRGRPRKDASDSAPLFQVEEPQVS